jgi:hypothetical protein
MNLLSKRHDKIPDMTFRIEWRLDESKGLVQESLLGDIKIYDKEHCINEYSVYIDSWLDALIRGAEFTKANEEAKIEIPEESHPIILCCKQDGRIAASFRGQAVNADSISEFVSELRSASGAFLEKIKALKGLEQNTMVSSIRGFWDRSNPNA